ncbi:MAG TPA: Hsp70 family protein [Polyangiaceae bacterium]|nr:Hsp70 family protein [Polyangiaceae bacterium]
MKPVNVGIDLGTTYSLVATLDGGEPRVLPNAVGELLTPSAVSLDEDGTVLVGAAARARATSHPTRTALAFKRDIGTARQFELGGRLFSPVELSALVLAELKRDAEAALGASIAEAVVTVPAYFGEFQRRATRDACALAGLNVERIINEPTAAALAYGLHQRDREFRAVVIDLGGGTFDVTVLEVMEGVIEIQASAGDTRLGGEDFVDAMLEHALVRLRDDHHAEVEPTVGRARLRAAVEGAKRRLSSEARAEVLLPALPTSAGPRDATFAFERAEVDALFAPLLGRMVGPIERALRDAQLPARRVDEVLLVGGATRMPCVARLVAELFGRIPLRTLPPDEAVALGAAVQAALKAGDAAVGDLVTTDIAPFSLGVATAEKLGEAVVSDIFTPIIERGTVLPVSRVRPFSTLGSNQTQIRLSVFQGEHAQCSKNQKIGEYLIQGVPAREGGGETVEVRFSYDMNGVLDVDATVVATGKTASFTIERDSGRLSKQALAEARKNLARLKFHPRDALPNVTLLARADALFVELTRFERERLGHLLAAFRAALESQDAPSIERTRASLQELVSALGKGGAR